MPYTWTRMRARVYVDGFNLYYRVLRGTPFKWLDPVRLATLLLPRDWTIYQLRYFTARVSRRLDPRASARQQVYLKAPATLPEVGTHDGRFCAKTAWCPLANLPVGTYPDRFGVREGGLFGSRTPLSDCVCATRIWCDRCG